MRSLSSVGWLWVALAGIAVAATACFSLGLWHHYGPGVTGGILGFTYVAMRSCSAYEAGAAGAGNLRRRDPPGRHQPARSHGVHGAQRLPAQGWRRQGGGPE